LFLQNPFTSSFCLSIILLLRVSRLNAVVSLSLSHPLSLSFLFFSFMQQHFSNVKKNILYCITHWQSNTVKRNYQSIPILRHTQTWPRT
jgi:hypothetical protein